MSNRVKKDPLLIKAFYNKGCFGVTEASSVQKYERVLWLKAKQLLKKQVTLGLSEAGELKIKKDQLKLDRRRQGAWQGNYIPVRALVPVETSGSQLNIDKPLIGVSVLIRAHNMFIAIQTRAGQVITMGSAGAIGVQYRPHKRSHITAYKLVRKLSKVAFKKGIRVISFYQKEGISRRMWRNIRKGLKQEGLKLSSSGRKGRRTPMRYYKIFARIPHNGTRLPKRGKVTRKYRPRVNYTVFKRRVPFF